MVGKTNAERQAAYRQRQAEQATAEVRGIFAHKDDHAAIKNYAAKLTKKRAKAANALAQADAACGVSPGAEC